MAVQLIRLLTLAVAAALTLSVGMPAAAARSNDATAIAAFLSLGLANASSNFRALAGASDGSNDWTATNPDQTRFSSCTVSYFEGDEDSPPQYLYTCYSVPHRGGREALFAAASQAVAANVPASYKGKTVTTSPSKIAQYWSNVRGPGIGVEVKTEEGGKPFYELYITVCCQSGIK